MFPIAIEELVLLTLLCRKWFTRDTNAVSPCDKKQQQQQHLVFEKCVTNTLLASTPMVFYLNMSYIGW